MTFTEQHDDEPTVYSDWKRFYNNILMEFWPPPHAWTRSDYNISLIMQKEMCFHFSSLPAVLRAQI